MSNLKKLTSGVRWGVISVIFVTMFQLIFVSIMARLLDPQDFGIVAVAHVSLRFFKYFAQLGITPALIQKPKLTRGDVRAALSISMGISTIFCILAIASAQVIENFFGMRNLAEIIAVLSLNFIFIGFSAISTGLLRRKCSFKAIAINEVISYVFGYGLMGFTFAYLGAGVWSLPVAYLSQSIITAMLNYRTERHSLRLRHTRKQRRHFLSYGGRYSLIGFVEFLTSNIDAFVIAKLFGAAPAGYYNRALVLANLPVQQPTNVLSKTLFPIMSSVSNSDKQQSYASQLSIFFAGIYAFSVSAGIYISAPDIVGVLLGPQWESSVPILKTLSWSVGPIYVSHMLGVTFDSMNQLKSKMRIQVSALILMIALIYIAIPTQSLNNVALALVLTEWFRLSVSGHFVVRFLNIPVSEYLRIVGSIVCAMLITSVFIYSASYLFSNMQSPLLRLIIDIIAGVLGLGLGFICAGLIIRKHPATTFLLLHFPRLKAILPKSVL